MIVEKYERSFEQNDELGLNDMRTENYADDKDKDAELGRAHLFTKASLSPGPAHKAVASRRVSSNKSDADRGTSNSGSGSAQ